MLDSEPQRRSGNVGDDQLRTRVRFSFVVSSLRRASRVRAHERIDDAKRDQRSGRRQLRE
jgi:hypothetical protein